jgi:hypothetical protein
MGPKGNSNFIPYKLKCEFVITMTFVNKFDCTIKPVYNDHPRDPKIVVVVDRWSLFRGHLCYKRSNWDLKIVAVVDRWSLFGSGRWLRVDCTTIIEKKPHKMVIAKVQDCRLMTNYNFKKNDINQKNR